MTQVQGGSMFDGLAVGVSSPAAQAHASQPGTAIQDGPADGPASAADRFGGLSLSAPGQSGASSGAGQASADLLAGLTLPSAAPASAGEPCLATEMEQCVG